MWIHFALGLLLWFLSPAYAATEQQPVSVQVQETTRNDGLSVYRYTVTNNSANPLVGFAVGVNFQSGVAELDQDPDGWSPSGGIRPGTVLAPTRWNARVITPEESPYIWIEWRTRESDALLPGKSLQGFAVAIRQKQNPTYLASQWSAFFTRGPVLTGRLNGAAPFFPARPPTAEILTAEGILIDYGKTPVSGTVTLQDAKSGKKTSFYVGDLFRVNGKVITCVAPHGSTRPYDPSRCVDWPESVTLGKTVVKATYWHSNPEKYGDTIKVADRVDVVE